MCIPFSTHWSRKKGAFWSLWYEMFQHKPRELGAQEAVGRCGDLYGFAMTLQTNRVTGAMEDIQVYYVSAKSNLLETVWKVVNLFHIWLH